MGKSVEETLGEIVKKNLDMRNYSLSAERRRRRFLIGAAVAVGIVLIAAVVIL